MWISIRDSPIPIQTMAHTTHFWGQMCFWLRYASHSGRQIFHNQQMDLLQVCILSFWPRRFALDNRMNHGLWHRVFLDLMKTLRQCIMWVFWWMPKDQMKETIYGKVFFFFQLLFKLPLLSHLISSSPRGGQFSLWHVNSGHPQSPFQEMISFFYSNG